MLIDSIMIVGCKMTKDYYEKNSEKFIEETINSDMSVQYLMFEKYLKTNDYILDLGFGSGRDSLYFRKKYLVTSIDPVGSFVINAKKFGLTNVYQTSVLEMDFENHFNGIWACATLLHVDKSDLNLAFKKCAKALKNDGIMYVSFKYGDFEGLRNGRYYLDLTETSILHFLNDVNLKMLEYSITSDVRPNRNDKWLNVILKKCKE